MPDVVTFGEAMIRLSPPLHRRLEQTTTLDVTVGGAELNVAVGVRRLGHSSEWVSCLPSNPLGRMACDKAREQGVGTDSIAWDTRGRMGLYFVEYGSSPRPSSVLYDRAGSSVSRLENVEFQWESILADARVFHTTGITTALSDRTANQVRHAMETARRLGVTVSYDLNYRGMLWDETRARAIQEPLMGLVDVLVTTEEDTRRVFGIDAPDYEEVARKLADRYGFKIVAITLRGDTSVMLNDWTSIAYCDGRVIRDQTYSIELVDRVGGGDAYVAGFLSGLLEGGVDDAVRYGNAFSALKQTQWGDLTWSTRAEVETLLAGGGSRIVR